MSTRIYNVVGGWEINLILLLLATSLCAGLDQLSEISCIRVSNMSGSWSNLCSRGCSLAVIYPVRDQTDLGCYRCPGVVALFWPEFAQWVRDKGLIEPSFIQSPKAGIRPPSPAAKVINLYRRAPIISRAALGSE
ncbi:hypothetical protein F5B21DRAFT_456422 [Xylaria acuta]|nr:hypothetical protein F5B21DRAFT_456422 [Xylaria acuta]